MLNRLKQSALESNSYYLRVFFSAVIATTSVILVSLSLLSWSHVFLLTLLTICLVLYSNKLSDSMSSYWQLLILPIIFLAFSTATLKHSDISTITIFSTSELYTGGKPFTLNLNVGKTCAGYLLLIWLLPLYSRHNLPILNVKTSIFYTLAFVVAIITTAIFFLDLALIIKPLVFIMLFLPVNALTTCLSEEAFSRLALQKPLENICHGVIPSQLLVKLIPLIITTTVFVLLHSATEMSMILVFGLSGFLYGLIYAITNRILFSIILHFFINAIHFSFLTYPI